MLPMQYKYYDYLYYTYIILYNINSRFVVEIAVFVYLTTYYIKII